MKQLIAIILCCIALNGFCIEQNTQEVIEDLKITIRLLEGRISIMEAVIYLQELAPANLVMHEWRVVPDVYESLEIEDYEWLNPQHE